MKSVVLFFALTLAVAHSAVTPTTTTTSSNMNGKYVISNPMTDVHFSKGETKPTICGELVNYPENPRLCREIKTLQNQETRK